MNDVLLNRRRAMMQSGYKVNWYPIIQGSITAQDMIDELGDLFQTYDDAPDAHPTISKHPIKTSAFAINKNITTIELGHNLAKSCIVYEEGQAPIIFDTSASRQTINFVSNQTYKHVVCYNSNLGGNQSITGIRWIINENVNGLSDVDRDVKYYHIPYNSTNISLQYGGGTTVGPLAYPDSIFYIPDWFDGYIISFMNCKYKKIRLSKGIRLGTSIYFWGNSNAASHMPNLTDIYVHWELGEVPQQPGTRYTGQWKLHIPDLGNAEDNAALVQEYRDKNWGRVSGLGIFNDVEATEPQEQLD